MYTLNIYHQNVRGLRTKTLTFFRNLAKNDYYHIISLTETWLVSDISSSELFNDNYLIWRRDRATGQSRGGGVLVAIRRDLIATENVGWQSSAEDIWISVHLRDGPGKSMQKLHICTLYLCDQYQGHSFSNQLTIYLDKLADLFIERPSDKFIILGDFNMSAITWSESEDGIRAVAPSTVSSSSTLSANMFTHFIDTLDFCSLKQFNLVQNKHGRILDLVLSNTNISVSACLQPLTVEDPHHPALLVQLDVSQSQSLIAQKRLMYQYTKGNYDRIRSSLADTQWNDLFSECSTNDAVSKFYSKLVELRDSHIPKRLHKNNNYPRWYNSALIKILKEKHKYFTKFKIYGNKHDLLTFHILRDRANSVEQTCFHKYIANIETAITSNPKYFWSYVKCRRTHTNFPSNMSYNGNESHTGQGICELFSNYFQSTFLDSTTTCTHSASRDDSNCHISSIEINPDIVRKYLQSLDLNKSAGPDAIPAIFLVKCANELAYPVSLLFTKSLSEGVVPTIWKTAFISPIHKKGAKDVVENYRPISKLCLLAKIFERIIYDQLYSSILPDLNPQQHGFLKGRSTVSNLVVFTDYVTRQMVTSGQVDAIYTDFSKAFDRIDHVILLKKLFNLGIRGDLYRWFSSYVFNRTQAVVLGGYTSSWTAIPSGVPQGSLLGPLLFVIYINDIGDCFKHSQFLLFADDMKMFMAIDNPSNALLLQEDLERVANYCKTNNLILNISKCSVITFSRKTQTVQFKYSIENQPLLRVSDIRDLGVHLDSKLTFVNHIDMIAKKASSALGFIIRNASIFKTMKTLKVLYCAYVRSHLEYASQVWNPNYAVHSQRLERIQKKFIRYLGYKFKIPRSKYIVRCARFHLLPLSTRRNISDIRLLMKIAQSKIDCSDLVGKLSLYVPPRHARPRRLLHVPPARTNYRKHSFLLRSQTAFNEFIEHEGHTIDLYSSKLSHVNLAYVTLNS